MKTVTAAAKLTPQSWVASVEHPAIVKMHDEMLATKFMAPSTDCLAPIDAKNLLRGLSKEIGAEFFAAETRSPSVGRITFLGGSCDCLRREAAW